MLTKSHKSDVTLGLTPFQKLINQLRKFKIITASWWIICIIIFFPLCFSSSLRMTEKARRLKSCLTSRNSEFDFHWITPEFLLTLWSLLFLFFLPIITQALSELGWDFALTAVAFTWIKYTGCVYHSQISALSHFKGRLSCPITWVTMVIKVTVTEETKSSLLYCSPAVLARAKLVTD